MNFEWYQVAEVEKLLIISEFTQEVEIKYMKVRKLSRVK
jgi:hypothetical protein